MDEPDRGASMIDPNEAPEGYVAVASTDSCTGCAFSDLTLSSRCSRPFCGAPCTLDGGREDGQDVIFIKREEAKPIGEAIESPFADVDAALKSARLPASPDWVIRPIGAAAMDVAIPALHALRDEFAKAALGEVYSTAVHEASQGSGLFATPDWRVGVALDAFTLADAMLAAKFNTMTWGQK